MNLDQFTLNGKFLMLALDHRGSFKKLINPKNPELVTDGEMISLKSEIIKSLEDQFSGLLIDQNWGLKAYPQRKKPFLLPVERSGYLDKNGERVTELEYSAQHIKELGVSGAKLLIYFNPNAQNATLQLQTAKTALEDCQNNNLPLFLEIVTYGEEENLVINSLKKFQEAGIVPDVWKLEYPGNLENCQKITVMSGETPWILLTGGQSFEEFKSELEIAVKEGAKGFLAGRALWQEVCRLNGLEKEKFLKETLPERFKILTEIMQL